MNASNHCDDCGGTFPTHNEGCQYRIDTIVERATRDENDVLYCPCGVSEEHQPCRADGTPVEPTEALWPEPFYVCVYCGRVVHDPTLNIVGQVTPEFAQQDPIESCGNCNDTGWVTVGHPSRLANSPAAEDCDYPCPECNGRVFTNSRKGANHVTV